MSLFRSAKATEQQYYLHFGPLVHCKIVKIVRHQRDNMQCEAYNSQSSVFGGKSALFRKMSYEHSLTGLVSHCDRAAEQKLINSLFNKFTYHFDTQVSIISAFRHVLGQPLRPNYVDTVCCYILLCGPSETSD